MRVLLIRCEGIPRSVYKVRYRIIKEGNLGEKTRHPALPGQFPVIIALSYSPNGTEPPLTAEFLLRPPVERNGRRSQCEACQSHLSCQKLLNPACQEGPWNIEKHGKAPCLPLNLIRDNLPSTPVQPLFWSIVLRRPTHYPTSAGWCPAETATPNCPPLAPFALGRFFPGSMRLSFDEGRHWLRVESRYCSRTCSRGSWKGLCPVWVKTSWWSCRSAVLLYREEL